MHENAALDDLATEVVQGRSDPYAAADLLLEIGIIKQQPDLKALADTQFIQ